jgi:hypothetical protein
MKRAMLVLVILVGGAIAVSPASGGIAETIKLSPRNASGVMGTATVASPGDASAAAVRVNVRGLKPRALVRIQLNVVNRKYTSASTVLIVSARAGAQGALVASGRVRYRGEPVTFATIADGAHAISVVTGGRVVARGIVPGMD